MRAHFRTIDLAFALLSPLASCLLGTPASAQQYVVVPSGQQPAYATPQGYQVVAGPAACAAEPATVVPPGCLGRMLGALGARLEQCSWPRVRPVAVATTRPQVVYMVAQPTAGVACQVPQVGLMNQPPPATYGTPQAPAYQAPPPKSYPTSQAPQPQAQVQAGGEAAPPLPLPTPTGSGPGAEKPK